MKKINKTHCFLDGDVITGNLIALLLNKEIYEIPLQKIYDFMYYVAEALNQNENTIILTSKEQLLNFVEIHNQHLIYDEFRELIIIDPESKEYFRRKYCEVFQEYIPILEKALLKTMSSET